MPQLMTYTERFEMFKDMILVCISEQALNQAYDFIDGYYKRNGESTPKYFGELYSKQMRYINEPPTIPQPDGYWKMRAIEMQKS